MRPGQQQNKQQRMRGRGRKGPNPMSRSFESNGPDVKIRGTAQHIADKYTTLARDASASGDRVMAENYLQHAEHYGRIVAAAQGQFQPSQPERDFDDMDEDGEDGAEFGGQQQPFVPERINNGQNGYQNGDRQPQAYRENGQGRDRDGNAQRGENRDGNGQRDSNGQRDANGPRDGNQPRGDRNERREFRENRGERPYQNRDNANRDGQNGDNRDGNREGGNRDGQNRDNRDGNPPRGDREAYQPRDQRDRAAAPTGSGPQPFVRDDGEADAAPQAARTEGGRREGRRERPRLNDRNGDRSFEDRFNRPRSNENQGDEAVSVSGDETSSLRQTTSRPDDRETAVSPQNAPMPSVGETQSPSAAQAENVESASEPRRRGRPRRERAEADDSASVAPMPASEAPAVVPSQAETRAEPAGTPEPKRRAPKAAAPVVEVTEAADAPAKRRPGRPRKKKSDDEGGEGEGEPHLPAFLLASNG